MEGGAVGHNFEMGLPKDYPSQIWFNLIQRFREENPRLVPFKIVSDSPALHSIWLLLLKIEISSIVHCCSSKWTIEEISIFSNSSHLTWRAGLSDTLLKWTYPEARFGLIWFSGFRGEDF
jgi:hypothetical protein